jgi:adenosylhomocysteine/aminodeoxyfutalosine nucleosidase
MTIGILGAMVEEIEPLLELFDEYKEHKYANNRYYEVKHKNSTLIIAYSKIGKVNATLSATVMIEKFKIDKMLFSGVAGAINENLHIGDLIVATSLCQHDVDITAFGHEYGYYPESKRFVDCDESLIEIAKNVAKRRDLKLIKGVIATGDQFIADSNRKDWIKDKFSADAIEMEGYPVAAVCDIYQKPCVIIRAISDAADMDANFDFDAFLFESAKNSALFILDMVNEIIEKN